MAFLQCVPLPINFTRILPMDTKSPFIRIKKSDVHPPPSFECRASSENFSNNNITQNNIIRRSANFKPSIWDYDYIQSLTSQYKEKLYPEQSRVLREEVRKTICKVEDHVDKLEVIDVLERLGISYHFKNEIRNILDNIYNNMDSFININNNNLYATAHMFRLLRQHGYHTTTDVFNNFLDEVIGNSKKHEYGDIEGMLALYEASFVSYEDEIILDKARDFTTKYLKEYVNKNNGGDNYLSLLISHALELPLHWRMPRWETQWFINVYEKSYNMRSSLVQLAKLDFNIVQAIHQQELKYASRWWKRIGFAEKLSFSRDRLMENYVWTVGSNYDPDYGYFRRVITRVNCFITTIDDIYDVYGTFEELELFTQVIHRWDQSYAMNNLPDYMQICFLELYNFVSEIALEFQRKSGFDITPYLKKAWTDLCKSYLVEAKWCHGRYIPRLGEYIENAWISISVPVTLIHTYFLIPNSFKRENLDSIEKYSNIIRFSGIILRLANDLGSSKREIEMGDVPKSIQCYMNESGASETEAREHIKNMMGTSWKKINKQIPNPTLPQTFIDIVINLPRTALCFYQYGDGYTVQNFETKSNILSLIVQPIQ